MSDLTATISQEKIMMQQSLELTSLSSSLSNDTLSGQLSTTSTDDADFILTGKRNESSCNSQVSCSDPLTYWDALMTSSDTSSIWDLYDRDNPFPQGVSPDDVLKKESLLQKIKKNLPNPMPYVAFVDMNNSEDSPYKNKPKQAIEIGLKFEF